MKQLTQHADEIRLGERFEFGKNWQAFLTVLNDERIEIAVNSLKQMLGVEHLRDKTFIDVGSGSGLFSLAAMRLGATVTSFDYDPASVACTRELKRRYYQNDHAWTIYQGSVLDSVFLVGLGTFDVVYSWGVLHHTGAMWKALVNVSALLGPRGRLFIAIYNDQGRKSRMWRRIKRWYCSGFIGRTLMTCCFIPYLFLQSVRSCIAQKQNIFATYRNERGMSILHDYIDWLGGYPFEVASHDAVVSFCAPLGLKLTKSIAVTHGANNQFVFELDDQQ